MLELDRFIEYFYKSLFFDSARHREGTRLSRNKVVVGEPVAGLECKNKKLFEKHTITSEKKYTLIIFIFIKILHRQYNKIKKMHKK